MARVDKKRHSGTTRKKVAIDHEPLSQTRLNNEPPKVPNAEPVAMEHVTTKQKAPIEIETHQPHHNEAQKSSHSNKNSHTASTMAAKGEDIAAFNKNNHHVSDKNNMSNQKHFSTTPAYQQNNIKKKSNGLLAGVAGGIIALIIAGGLQYSGILAPLQSHQQTYATDSSATTELFTNMQQEIAALKDEINNFKQQEQNAPNIIASSSSDLDKTILEKTTQTAQNASIVATQVQQSFNTLTPKIAQFTQELTSLKANIASIKEQSGQNNEGAVNENDPIIHALQNKIDVLNQNINTINNNINQRFMLIGNELNKTQKLADLVVENTSNIDRNNQALKSLASEIKKLPDPLAERNKAMSVLVAANALKSAIDRGGSYVNELTLFQEVAPTNISLDELKKYANSGVVSHAQLVEEFSRVADAIATSENQVDNNANWSQKIWGVTKGFVSVRPVGNIEGTSAAAIAARMEVAIKQDDYTRALSEWQTLPEPAKAVSFDFIEKLKTRNNIDNLLAELINFTLRPSAQAPSETLTQPDSQTLDVIPYQASPQHKGTQP